MSVRLCRLSVAVAVSACAPIAAAASPADPFDACRQQLRAKPQEYDSAYCFFTVAQRPGLWADGKRVLENLIREDPSNLWLSLVHGHLIRDREPDAAESLYRRTADGFRASGHAEGEFLARSSLRNFLSPRGRVDEANAQMARIAEISDAIDDPILKAQIWIVQASHIQDRGGDLGVAYRLLKQAERALFPGGPYRQQRNCLTWLGLIAFRMGRHDEALELFKSLDALAGRQGDLQTRAIAQYNLLNTWSLKESLLPSSGARTRLLELADDTLALAAAVQNQQVILKTRRTLAALMANDPARRDAALGHLDGCVELAGALRQPADEAACAWLQASILHSSDQAAARVANLRALRATERANSPLADAYSASRHMQFSWQSKPQSEAIRDSIAAIDAIETLRSLQEDGESSADLFSNWTLEYYWLSGRLLQAGGGAEVETAFTITERMRARSLLDSLSGSRLRPDPAMPAAIGRRALLKDIAGLQRRLMDPTLPAAARASELKSLTDLESRARDAERQIAAALRPHAVRPSFATLDALQSALADDEALLSFQVGIWESYEGDFGGGSWLLALTTGSRSVYRIPDRTQLAPIVPVFTGLLVNDGSAAGAAAARLYRDVFAGALERLPSSVRRLIVIPDGPLQQLPLETLRSESRAVPLAARYEMVVAPSATLWLQWRGYQAPAAPRSALVFADPDLGRSGSNAVTRTAALYQGLQLGRLPYARRESRAIERKLDGVDALVGPDASEHVLKARDPQQYALLHLAAHAVSDEVRPERSAVLLAAGSEGEDGLLQAREIQQLDLRGRIVILSACETASGAVLNGEGVLSLARAFFQAGARAVVGTRWRIRDEDAAELFGAFYDRLATGASLSKALASAKQDAIARGRPAQAWGSLILLGDGAATPFASSATASSIVRGLLPAVLLFAALLIFPLIFRRVRESLVG